MSVLRILLLAIFAAGLGGCAATIPLRQQPEDVTATIDEPDRPSAAEEPSEAEKPKPPAPKPATASTTSSNSKTSGKSETNATTPKVGSPEWKKERAEDERKEQHIKEVIEGICRGC